MLVRECAIQRISGLPGYNAVHGLSRPGQTSGTMIKNTGGQREPGVGYAMRRTGSEKMGFRIPVRDQRGSYPGVIHRTSSDFPREWDSRRIGSIAISGKSYSTFAHTYANRWNAVIWPKTPNISRSQPSQVSPKTVRGTNRPMTPKTRINTSRSALPRIPP